jgi:dolichol kinase
MLSEFPYAVIILGVVLVGLWISNMLYDRQIPHYISRKVGHSAGGLGFLATLFFFSSAVWPLILTAGFALVLSLARVLRPDTFRGVGGSGRNPNAMSEVWFALIAVPLYAIGWLWLKQPQITVACLLFMAWGDCVTGLVRAEVYKKAVKGLKGSAAMLIVCLILSWAFVHPFWIGGVVSLVATITEWSFGDVGILKFADDNWAIPVVSFGVMLGLLKLTGGI